MKKAVSITLVKKASEAEILKSAIASFKIENILISDAMAISAMEKARVRFRKETR